MEENPPEKRKFHYAWLILLSCCLIQGTGLGLVNNCIGLFYVPICSDLGFSRGSIALYATFQNMSCCFCMLCSKAILRRFKLQHVMAVASLLAGLPFFFLSHATQLWHWYVMGIIQGFGTAFLTSLVIPVLLRQWFDQKLGLVMGISSSFAGLTGAVMSAVLGVVIRSHSWRSGYFLSGIVALIMAFPVSLLVVRMHPEEIGLKPYGYTGIAEAAEIPRASAQRSKQSFIKILEIIALGILAKTFCSFISHLPAYGSSLSITIVDASLLTTFCMLGNMSTKLLFGPINDRIGPKKASDLAFLVIGIAILLLMSKIQLAMCFGSFLFGTVSMFSVTEVPLLARSIWDKAHYADTMVAINVASYLSYSLTIPLYGYLYDWLGRYDAIFVILLGLLAVEWLLLHMLFQKKSACC